MLSFLDFKDFTSIDSDSVLIKLIIDFLHTNTLIASSLKLEENKITSQMQKPIFRFPDE